MRPVTKLVVAVLPVLLMVGCGSTEVKEENIDSGEAVLVFGGASMSDASEGVPLGEGAIVGDAEPVAVVEAASANDDLLSERKIYFDFDLSEIGDEYRDVLTAHASYLAANPDASIVIEGHTDERGTREYNVALGESRAYIVSQFLALQGASSDQLRIVSFGEERADVEGHDDSAWKWNRRAVLIYSE